MPDESDSLTINYLRDGQSVNVVLPGPVAILGRDPQCDVVFPHGSGVSRNHAKIERGAEGWWLTDLESRYGTFLNGDRIARGALSHGDVVKLGTAVIRVLLSAANRATMASVVWDDGSLGQLVKSINMSDFAGRLRRDRGMRATTLGHESMIRLFHQAGEALLSCTEREPMLQRILELLFLTFPCERGAICLCDAEDNTLSVQATKTLAEDAGEIHISNSIAGEAIKAKNAILVRDAKQDLRFRVAASVMAMNICSAMCAPLFHDGQVRGLVYLDTLSEDRRFSEADLDILASMAIMTAVALQQAQLRDDVAREHRIRERLARYSSPAVVERIAEASPEEVEMVPEHKEVTVLFADLCGFTRMSESMTPAQVAAVLNDIFDRLTVAVFEHDGTIDKFIGDAVMAIFGTPLPQSDHAVRAVRTALRMFEELAAFNARNTGQSKLDMRIGINSGSAVAGDIGSPRRRDYTVIGDTVNVASRLESMVAQPHQIVIGPHTYQLVEGLFSCTPLPPAHLKGKAEVVQAYLVNFES